MTTRPPSRGGHGGFVTTHSIRIAPVRVAPGPPAMRGRIAELLAVPVARVSVKATTTEELGFTGRREGIAAQAIATARLPRRD